MPVLPQSFKDLFWDVDFSSLNLNKNKDFIIERVLDYGDISHFRKIKEIYSLDDIKNVLKKSKTISYKSANFYALILGVSREEVLCLKRPLTQKQDRF